MGKVFVSGVTGKVNRVDEIHVETKELEGEDCRPVADISVNDVRLNGEDTLDFHFADVFVVMLLCIERD